MFTIHVRFDLLGLQPLNQILVQKVDLVLVLPYCVLHLLVFANDLGLQFYDPLLQT